MVVSARLIRFAARRAPDSLSERLEEEWLGDLLQRDGPLARFALALGCCWAALVIAHDFSPSPTARMTAAGATSGTYIFGRENAPASSAAVLCEINTTPLIDVLLVLLVALVISLPLMTHAVKIDLPRAPSAPHAVQPEVIDLDVDLDGTVAWNGRTLSSSLQLDSYLRAAARQDPQPEIHLRADRNVKYDFVAKLLASAQRNGLKRIGFVDTSRFKD
jgi:biopolymer transport protein ExbD